MKKLSFFLLLYSLLYSSILYSAKATKPSPYFVHDSEVYFFDLYSRTQDLDAPRMFAASGILTPYQYVADIFFEIPFGLNRSIYSWDKASDLRKRNTYFSFFGGVAFQFQGDGHPDNNMSNIADGYAPNDNESALHLAGFTLFHKLAKIKLGYLFGVFHLEDRVYDQKTKSYLNGGEHFNYPSSSFTESGRGYERLYGNPSARYHRLFIEMESDFEFIIMRLLAVTNLVKKPALVRMAPEIIAKRGKYYITPYYAMTNDVEGVENFSVYQYGLSQTIYLNYSRDPFKLVQLRPDVNYTYATSTSLTGVKKEWYGTVELLLYTLSLSTWYNADNGVGAGIGHVQESRDFGRIWIMFKYNPFVSTPVYLRNINDHSWSFELGFHVKL